MKRIVTFALLLSGIAVAACRDSTSPESSPSFAIKFVAAPIAVVVAAAQDELTVEGTNGILTITDIHIIVEDFELEPVEVADCDDEPEPESCTDFEAHFFFVDVPLSGDPVTVVDEEILPGMYDELEFEVDDVEFDHDDDDDDEAEIRALFDTIRETFPNWPSKASMVVVGTFAPATGTDARGFTVFFEAEIEVELDLNPPLEITDADRSVVIELIPEVWFKRGNGTVLDLSQFDFAETDELIEFELEIEDGFELEIET